MILMGIDLDSIKDPRLRQTITDSLMGVAKLKQDLAAEIPKTAKAHNMEHGIGEIELNPCKCPCDEPLEVGKDGIQSQIKEWCNRQWPWWIVDNPRSDKKSTVPKGRHDMTIYAPGGKVYNIEVKRKGQKLRPEQVKWKERMNNLGHAVYVVHSLEEFLEIVAPSLPSSPSPQSGLCQT